MPQELHVQISTGGIEELITFEEKVVRLVLPKLIFLCFVHFPRYREGSMVGLHGPWVL